MCFLPHKGPLKCVFRNAYYSDYAFLLHKVYQSFTVTAFHFGIACVVITI